MIDFPYWVKITPCEMRTRSKVFPQGGGVGIRATRHGAIKITVQTPVRWPR